MGNGFRSLGICIQGTKLCGVAGVMGWLVFALVVFFSPFESSSWVKTYEKMLENAGLLGSENSKSPYPAVLN